MNRLAVRSIFFLSVMLVVNTGANAAATRGGGQVDVLEGPTLTMNPNGVTPLAGLVEVETNRPVRARLRISDGIETWWVRFPQRRSKHELPLLGLKPDRAYEVEVGLSPGGKLPTLLAVTDPLPDDFPEIRVEVSDPQRMEPGFTILDRFGRAAGDARPTYTMILDNGGDVVWYSTLGGPTIRQIDSGNLLYRSGHDAVEMDLLGNVVERTPLDVPGLSLHHELTKTSRGTYLSLSREVFTVQDYPGSETDPGAPPRTADVLDEPVVEFAHDGTLLNEWPLRDIIDPTRIAYDSLGMGPGNAGLDWIHANAAVEDPRDDSIIVSLRHQDAVVKFSRDTGRPIWILGPHENWSPDFEPFLLDPVGAPFEWQYHQHAPAITPQGTILLFDNGNWRASPFDGQAPLTAWETFSRAVEYEIDEENGTVRQVWEFGDGAAEPRVYSGFLGDVDWLDQTGNVLITFGATSIAGGVAVSDLGRGDKHARIVEVDHGLPARTVFDVMVIDPEGEILVYRSERIGGLYPRDGSSAAQRRSRRETNGRPNTRYRSPSLLAGDEGGASSRH